MEDFKQARRTYFAIGGIYLVFGLVLTVWPEIMAEVVTTVLGVVSIVIGIIRLIEYFSGDRSHSVFKYDMVIGILFVGFGLFTLIWPSVIQSILPVIFGIFLIISSLIKLQNSVDLKRLGYERWWFVLIMGVISAILGIVVICNPFKAITLLIRVIGIFLMIDGITSLVSMFMFSKELRRIKKATIEGNTANTESAGNEGDAASAENAGNTADAVNTADAAIPENEVIPGNDVTAGNPGNDANAANTVNAASAGNEVK